MVECDAIAAGGYAGDLEKAGRIGDQRAAGGVRDGRRARGGAPPSRATIGGKAQRDGAVIGDEVVRFPHGGLPHAHHVARRGIGCHEIAFDRDHGNVLSGDLVNAEGGVAGVQLDGEFSGQESGELKIGFAACTGVDDGGRQRRGGGGAVGQQVIIVRHAFHSGGLFQIHRSRPQMRLRGRIAQHVLPPRPTVEVTDQRDVGVSGRGRRGAADPFHGKLLGGFVECDAIRAAAEALVRYICAIGIRSVCLRGHAGQDRAAAPVHGPSAVGGKLKQPTCRGERLGADPGIVRHQLHGGRGAPVVVRAGNRHGRIGRCLGLSG